jgi:hypothetical protein
VKNDTMSVGNHEAGGHLPQSVGGAGYENTCHRINSCPVYEYP